MVNAYIANANDNTVSVIDTSTNTVVGSPISVGNKPRGVAVSPGGNTVFVANINTGGGNGTVSIIDTVTNTVIATITVGSGPNGAAISPDGTTLYVTNLTGGSVSVINTATRTVATTITLGSGTDPDGVAFTPDGKTVYVVGLDAIVYVIDALTNSVSTTISIGVSGTNQPHGVAISPDGTTAYVTNDIVDIHGTPLNGTVVVIDTATNTISTTITLEKGTYGIAITPDGTTLYVGNNVSGTVSVIDTSTNTVSTTITVGTSPTGIAITPDGSAAYVPNAGSNNVSVIDTSTNTVSTTITVGTLPDSFGIFIQPASIPMTSIYTAPQGRLTLTSNTPVMTADATAQASVYYTPYQGNIVPIYDGANMQSYTFGQLTMALNTSNQTSGNLYDLVAFLNSSVVTIGAGPAWSSATSRGTGAGTTELQQTDGLWVNANTITLKNGSTSYSSIPVGEATYLGTVYMTANGQTGVTLAPAAASGGNNSIIGLWNAYNRVKIKSRSWDSTVDWTYTGTSFRAANASNNNRISWIDGLQQTNIGAAYGVVTVNSTTDYCIVGIGINSTSVASGTTPLASGTSDQSEMAVVNSYPLLGFNYVQALEAVQAGTGYFYGDGLYSMLVLDTEY